VRSGPTLINNTATGRWLLAHEECYWTITATRDALTLASFLEINFIDRSSSEYLAVPTGDVVILKTSDIDCDIELVPIARDGAIHTLTIEPDPVDFGIVELIFGFHKDKWVETNSVLAVENVKTLGIRLYLPEVKGKGNKKLSIVHKDDVLCQMALKRGDVNEVWVEFPETKTGRNEIVIRAAYKEPNPTDERDLGMIITEVNINLTNWQDVEAIL